MWNKNKPTVSGQYLAKNSRSKEPNLYRFDDVTGNWYGGERQTTLVHNIVEWEDELAK